VVFPFYLSPWTDCYPDEEKENEYTRDILKALAQRNMPFFIITKSPLVLRDVEFFTKRENAFIAISLNTIDDSVTRIFEPKAPSASKRKALIERLVSIPYLKTVVKIDPILPGITDGSCLEDLTEWLCTIKPTAVTVETLRISGDMADNLRSEISNHMYNSLIGYYDMLNTVPQHPYLDYRLSLFKSLRDKFTASGVRVAFCRATLPSPITSYDCRGGY